MRHWHFLKSTRDIRTPVKGPLHGACFVRECFYRPGEGFKKGPGLDLPVINLLLPGHAHYYDIHFYIMRAGCSVWSPPFFPFVIVVSRLDMFFYNLYV